MVIVIHYPFLLSSVLIDLLAVLQILKSWLAKYSKSILMWSCTNRIFTTWIVRLRKPSGLWRRNNYKAEFRSISTCAKYGRPGYIETTLFPGGDTVRLLVILLRITQLCGVSFYF